MATAPSGREHAAAAGAAGLEERSDRQDQEALAEQIVQISELLRQLDGRMRR
jgi:hypothetical protein